MKHPKKENDNIDEILARTDKYLESLQSLIENHGTPLSNRLIRRIYELLKCSKKIEVIKDK